MTNPERKTPEEFADEILGSADEQLYGWYERQIAWRQRMLQQYKYELEVLETHFEPVRKRIEERDQLRRVQADRAPSDTDPDLGGKLATLAGGATGLIRPDEPDDGLPGVEQTSSSQYRDIEEVRAAEQDA